MPFSTSSTATQWCFSRSASWPTPTVNCQHKWASRSTTSQVMWRRQSLMRRNWSKLRLNLRSVRLSTLLIIDGLFTTSWYSNRTSLMRCFLVVRLSRSKPIFCCRRLMKRFPRWKPAGWRSSHFKWKNFCRRANSWKRYLERLLSKSWWRKSKYKRLSMDSARRSSLKMTNPSRFS